MRIAFLVQLPKRVSPGQRFRIEQFEPHLLTEGHKLDTYPFFGMATYKILYKQGFYFEKAFGVFLGFCKRFFFLFTAYKYDFIFIQREVTPIGPPVIEWVLAKLLKKKLIYDFDDAIWIQDESRKSSFFKKIKCFWKIKYVCRWSYKVSVGNEYLAEYARKFNKEVVVIPTCVDIKNRYNQIKDQNTERIVIGWTGSHSTLKYLDIIFPVLKELEKQYHFTFLVICDRPPGFQLKSLEFVKWNEETEIEDLLSINIGLMPLIEDAWSEGKCGFKLIQYLSLGIPAIASPVGVNQQILESNINGFLCNNQSEWLSSLISLAESKDDRVRMGLAGKKKINDYYSVQANVAVFLQLFS